MKMNNKCQYNYVNFNDGKFCFINWGGSGPLVHISHSIGFCAGVYTPFAEKLKPYLNVIGMDHRGHGKTRALADPQLLKNWNIFYDDLECFFKYLNQPLIAIGHSMGGTISMVTAIRQPDLVRALILIEPGIMPPSWVLGTYLLQKCGLTWTVPMVAKTSKRRKEWPDRESLRAYFSSRNSIRYWEKEFFDAYMDHVVNETNAGCVELCCSPTWQSRCIATAPTDIWHYVSKLKTPTLIIYGSKTKTFLPSVIKRLKSKVPHSIFNCFEGAGHNVIMERPDESAEAIINFLKNKRII